MRGATGTLRLIWAIALVPVLADAALLWRGRLAVLASTITLYHLITRFCRQAFQPGTVELAAGLVVGGLVVGGLVAGRGLLELVRRYHRTTNRVGRVLTTTTSVWPPALQAAAAHLRLTDCIALVQAPAPFALCYGFFRPRILVSTGLVSLLSPVELEAVLLHEDDHRRHQEPRRVLVIAVLAHAFFFIPTLKDLRQRYEALKEFRADTAAVEAQGTVAPLASALYMVLAHNQRGPDLQLTAVGELSVTEQRIDELLTPGAARLPSCSFVRMVASTLAVLALVLPVLPIAAASAQPMIDTCRHF